MCGLKQQDLGHITLDQSHTLRGCVDWNLESHNEPKPRAVTPCVGVWIETIQVLNSIYLKSHTLRGCVDWNWVILGTEVSADGHTLRGCVDWNISIASPVKCWDGHTLRGCVDWNSQRTLCIQISKRHTLRGCVDWNILYTCFNDKHNTSHTLRGCVDWNININYIRPTANIVTPCVGVWIETNNRSTIVIASRVTPCVGVWIETALIIAARAWAIGHTLRGCVDWNIRHIIHSSRLRSHPAWVCGLKHQLFVQ